MTSGNGRTWLIPWLAALVASCTVMIPFNGDAAAGKSLWPLYEQSLTGAKYVDLTHTVAEQVRRGDDVERRCPLQQPIGHQIDADQLGFCAASRKSSPCCV
jgi:hypothetical protein